MSFFVFVGNISVLTEKQILIHRTVTSIPDSIKALPTPNFLYKKIPLSETLVKLVKNCFLKVLVGNAPQDWQPGDRN